MIDICSLSANWSPQNNIEQPAVVSQYQRRCTVHPPAAPETPRADRVRHLLIHQAAREGAGSGSGRCPFRRSHDIASYYRAYNRGYLVSFQWINVEYLTTYHLPSKLLVDYEMIMLYINVHIDRCTQYSKLLVDCQALPGKLPVDCQIEICIPCSRCAIAWLYQVTFESWG